MRRSDSGQVDFLGILPLLIPLLVLVWEAFLIGMSFTYAGHGANEGARAAAVGGDVEKAAMERISGAWADPKNADVNYPTDRSDPNYGYVEVRIRPPLIFPGVSLPLSISARSQVVYEGVE